jgi:hypothetical protein
MSKPKGVSLDELDKLRKAEASGPRFSAQDERRHALLLLGDLAELSQLERGRVLRRALKINEV